MNVKAAGIIVGKIFVWFILSIIYLAHWGAMTIAVKFVVPVLSKVGVTPSWSVSSDYNSAWRSALSDVGFSSLNDFKFWKKL